MASATAKLKPTESKKIIRAIAPKTGGVRYPCLLCDMKDYSTWSTQEQMEIFNLQEEIIEIWETNRCMAEKLKSMKEDEKKLKSMNDEMQLFFSKIPLGNLTATISTQTEEIVTFATLCDTNNNNVQIEAVEKGSDERIRNKNVWSEKERKMQLDVIHQQKRLIADMMLEKSRRPLVSKEFWGHKSRSWPKPSKSFQPRSSQKSSNSRSSQLSSKPFSIPFRPKPLHLMVRKAYLKPPSKLSPHFPSPQPTARLPECGALQCDDSLNIVVREMFANALERAINSNEQTASDVPGLSWEEHPFYDNLDHDEAEQVSDPPDDAPDDTHEVAWEDHPYYDDLGSSETDRGEDDELDRPQNTSTHDVDQQESDDEVVPEDAQEEVAWEDHPHYDTPAEEEDQLTESDVPEDEEDVAWEDSPYY